MLKRISHFISIVFATFVILSCTINAATVELGVDRVFKEEQFFLSLQNKKIALVTNHTGLCSDLKLTTDLFIENQLLTAIFTPEHGLTGAIHAGESVGDTSYKGVPVYSLYGKTRRPTPKMLQDINTIVFDIQETGVRPYTYTTTLFYIMEEAAKKGIEVIVLDRPNPINGLIVDGPMLKKRSFLGYINIPYCHGMTIGELALLFNGEYKVNCKLKVIPMKGWKRWMRFADTNLAWIPTSPNIPEENTPIFLASTGLIGELELVNIGIGYTLPFKIVGAPWINAKLFATKLNSQQISGVHFLPFYFRPFYGTYKGKDCQGVKIVITDYNKYKPITVQYLILGMLKSLYPIETEKCITETPDAKKELFCAAIGSDYILQLLQNEKFIFWKLNTFQSEERHKFLNLRKKYLLYDSESNNNILLY